MNLVVSSFIDCGAGLVLFMVCFSPKIEQRKQVYNCKANHVSMVYNEWTNHLLVYRRLLINR